MQQNKKKLAILDRSFENYDRKTKKIKISLRIPGMNRAIISKSDKLKQFSTKINPYINFMTQNSNFQSVFYLHLCFRVKTDYLILRIYVNLRKYNDFKPYTY